MRRESRGLRRAADDARWYDDRSRPGGAPADRRGHDALRLGPEPRTNGHAFAAGRRHRPHDELLEGRVPPLVGAGGNLRLHARRAAKGRNALLVLGARRTAASGPVAQGGRRLRRCGAWSFLSSRRRSRDAVSAAFDERATNVTPSDPRSAREECSERSTRTSRPASRDGWPYLFGRSLNDGLVWMKIKQATPAASAATTRATFVLLLRGTDSLRSAQLA
jgi:hypothetical protein